MIRKIPIVAHPITFDDLLKGFQKFPKGKLSKKLTEHINGKYIYFASSGSAALYLILKAISEGDSRTEVIIPAYTASSVVYAIKKAGLNPVLCDISLNDFNMDMDKAVRLFNKNTLAIIGVHMFGIVQNGLPQLQRSFPGVYTIEDCCQSFGSKIKNYNIGGLGAVSFSSFNRGKNLPVFGGGIIATNNVKLAGKIETLAQELEPQSAKAKMLNILKIFALSIAVNPYVYAMLDPLIQRFREKPPLREFDVRKFTNYQAAVALSLLENFYESAQQRYENAMKIIEAVKDIDGISGPYVDAQSQPAFNRLPLIFEDIDRKNKVAKRLLKAGIETSAMYYKPLHHLMDLGYKHDDFPNAVYFSDHLLTFPTHPFLQKDDINKIINIIKNVQQMSK